MIKKILEKTEKGTREKEEREYFQTHSRRYELTLKKISEIFQGEKGKILDVGCFPYQMGKILESLDYEVYGISSKHEPLKKEKIRILDIEKDNFPWKKESFDLCLFNEVIEHLPHSPVWGLKEMHRVAKKGGRLILTTPNAALLLKRVKLLFGRSVYYETWRLWENEGKGDSLYHRHNREYTMKELETILKKTGWKIEEKKYVTAYDPFRKGKGINILKIIYWAIVAPFPPLRDTILITARKV